MWRGIVSSIGDRVACRCSFRPSRGSFKDTTCGRCSMAVVARSLEVQVQRTNLTHHGVLSVSSTGITGFQFTRAYPARGAFFADVDGRAVRSDVNRDGTISVDIKDLPIDDDFSDDVLRSMRTGRFRHCFIATGVRRSAEDVLSVSGGRRIGGRCWFSLGVVTSGLVNAGRRLSILTWACR